MPKHRGKRSLVVLALNTRVLLCASALIVSGALVVAPAAESHAPESGQPTTAVQTFAASDEATLAPPSQDHYSVTDPPPSEATASAPPSASVEPGTAQAIAAEMTAGLGWGGGEFDCLVALWNRESGWNSSAQNSSSGAYGIPQALPGDKMSSAGADWQSNPATQIAWGLDYITGRYGTPCGAWGHSESVGWY